MVTIVALLLCVFARAENISYPDAGLVLNLVDDYGAVGTGNPADATTNTTALQNAIEDTRRYQPQAGMTIYIPDGTYYINDTVSGGTDHDDNMHIILQGQSKAGTIFKLDAGATGFQDAQSPKPMLLMLDLDGGNDSFQNSVSNLTLDTGDNQGAIALDFHSNNGGGVFDVLLKGSANAHTGLKVTRKNAGIALLRNLSIEGFKTGAHMADHHVTFVFDSCVFTGQSEVAVKSDDKPLSFFNCYSNNTVPFIETLSSGAQLVLVDCVLEGGATTETAVKNYGLSQVFIRNSYVDGYALAYDDGQTTLETTEAEEEFVSHGVFTLDPATPGRSLDIPVPVLPDVPWDTPTSPTSYVLYDDPHNIPTTQIADSGTWAVVDGSMLDGSGKWIDDTALLQAAIDSGATTVAFKGRGIIDLLDTVIVRGNVRRILGMGAEVIARSPMNKDETKAIFEFVDSNHATVKIERVDNGGHWSLRECLFVHNKRSQDLIIENVVMQFMRFYENDSSATGRAYLINNFVSPHWDDSPNQDEMYCVTVTGQEVHMMTHNSELLGSFHTGVLIPNGRSHDSKAFVINDGGTVTIRGFKLGEEHGPYVETLNGGFTEILGGVVNVADLGGADVGQYPFENNESSVSIVAVERQRYPVIDYPTHTIVLRETHDAQTSDLLPSAVPAREVPSAMGGFTLPLYVSYTARTGEFEVGSYATGRVRDNDNDDIADGVWASTDNLSLSVGRTDHEPDNFEWRSVLEFDLRGLEHEIQNADKIELAVTTKQIIGMTTVNPAILCEHLTDGNDGSITLIDYVSGSGMADSAPASAFAEDQRYVFNITTEIKSDLSNAEVFSAYRLRADLPQTNTTSNDQIVFHSSSENNESGLHPTLVFTYNTLTVVNNQPVARNDLATLDEDTDVTVSVLPNDSDPDGDTLSLTTLGTAANGTVTDLGNNTAKYEPDADFYGDDSFSYTISDGNGGTDTALVKLTVANINDSPTPQLDEISVDEDGTVSFVVLDNDTDPENNALSLISFTDVEHGTLKLGTRVREVFNYTDGAPLDETTVGGNGWGTVKPGYYQEASLVNVNSAAKVSDYNWNLPGGYGLNYANKTLVSNGTAVYRGLAVDEQFDSTSDAFYFSFTFNSYGNWGGNRIGFAPSNGAFNNLDLQIRQINSGAFRTYVDGTGLNASVAYGDEDLLIIGYIDPQATTDNFKVKIYRATDPVLPTEEWELISDTGDLSALGTFATVYFQPANVSAMGYGNFVMGNSWEAVTSNGDRTFNYEPDADYHGSDDFTYTVSDGLDTAVGTVNITVAGIPESVLQLSTADSGRVRDDDNNGTADNVWGQATEDSMNIGHTHHSPNKIWMGVVEFDIASHATAIDTADTIEIEVTVEDEWGFTGVDPNLQCYHLTSGDDGSVSLGDMNASATLVSNHPVSGFARLATYRFDVTSQVKADALNSESYSAFRFQIDMVPNSENSQVIFFTGQSDITEAHRPSLVITDD